VSETESEKLRNLITETSLVAFVQDLDQEIANTTVHMMTTYPAIDHFRSNYIEEPVTTVRSLQPIVKIDRPTLEKMPDWLVKNDQVFWSRDLDKWGLLVPSYTTFRIDCRVESAKSIRVVVGQFSSKLVSVSDASFVIPVLDPLPQTLEIIGEFLDCSDRRKIRLFSRGKDDIDYFRDRLKRLETKNAKLTVD
jgi:hypothetical protein